MSQATREPPPAPVEPEERQPSLRNRLSSRLLRVNDLELGGIRIPVVRIVVGVLLVGVLVVVSPSFFLWSLMVAAAIIAVPFTRLHAFAIAFLPYAAAWLIFTVIRASADETQVPLRTEAVVRIEQAIFFGTVPTIWLQNLLFNPLNLAWYDYLTTFVHWSYFLVPHGLAIYLWIRHRDLFTYYVLTTVLLLGIGLLVYFLAPAAPPWLTADTAPQEDVFRVMANVGRTINSSLYDRTYNVIGDSNPIAAMPSMHQAITFVVTIFAIRAGRWWAVAGIAYALAMGFSLIYTGEHYFIDVLVGSSLAAYAYYVAGRWLETTPPFLRLATKRSRTDAIQDPLATSS